jgi:hypothetical protein
MIARVWHGYTLPQHADAYEAMLKPELLPGVGKVQGYRDSYLFRCDRSWSRGRVHHRDAVGLNRRCPRRRRPDFETAVVPE